jgi:hypothetical protein
VKRDRVKTNMSHEHDHGSLPFPMHFLAAGLNADDL